MTRGRWLRSRRDFSHDELEVLHAMASIVRACVGGVEECTCISF